MEKSSKILIVLGLLVFLIIVLWPGLPIDKPLFKPNAFSTGSFPQGDLNPDSLAKSNSNSNSRLVQESQLPELVFQEVGLDLGLIAFHQQSSEELSALTETLGAGVCVLDVNQDGWMDIFFVGGSGHNRSYGKQAFWNKHQGNRLFINQGGKHFIDQTQAFGLDKKMWGIACSVGDFDQDGFPDVFVAGVGGVSFFKNNGGSAFEDVDLNLKNQDLWSTGVSLIDFDKDGLLDIYVTNYVFFKKGQRTFEQATGFDAIIDTAFNPALYDPQGNGFYKNLGNFKFKDVSEELGVSNHQGRSLASYWLDLNQDGWDDLIVINDASPNRVFINDNGKHFIEGSHQFAPFELTNSHGFAAGDIDSDGQLEFLISRQTGSPSVLLTRNVGTNEKDQSTFKDISWPSGLAKAENLPFAGWAAILADFNNDGLEDVFIANGRALPDSDSHFVSQAQVNSFFLNTGQGDFNLMSTWNKSLAPYSSRGAATLDIDNDGYLELLVANNNDSLQVFKNAGDRSRQWLGLAFTSRAFSPSTPGIINASENIYGSKIEVWTDKGFFQKLIVRPQSTFSQSDPRFLMGLNDSKHIEKMIVHWKNGGKQTFKNIKPNHYYTLDKSEESLQLVQASDFKNTLNKDLAGLVKNLSQRPDSMLDYLAIASLNNKVSVELISGLWFKADESQKLVLLGWMDKHWQLDYLLMIKQALASNNQALRLKALAILQKAELEVSVAWLLPLLFDDNPAVQCQVAGMFQFFFEEEEALIHRKYLAIAYLSRLILSDENNDVVQCAIQALGAGEKKRAIAPLIQIATTSNNSDVQIAALSALGLIRDTSSLPVLRQIPKGIQSSTPDISNDRGGIIAASFIARARLNDPLLLKSMDSFFLDQYQKGLLTLRANTLASLFAGEGHVVFKQARLNRYLGSILNATVKAHSLPKAQQLALVNMISASKNSGKASALLAFIDIGKDKNIAFAAFKALLDIGQPMQIKQVEKQFSSRITSLDVNQHILLIQTANKRRYQFSKQSQNKFLEHAFDNEELMSILLDQWQFVPKNSVVNLMERALNTSETIKQKITILDLCQRRSVPWSSVFKPLPGSSKGTSGELDVALLNCALQNLPETRLFSEKLLSDLLASSDFKPSLLANLHVTSNNDALSLKLRQLVRDLYKDESLPLRNRQALLIYSSSSDSILAKTFLISAMNDISNKHDELNFMALDALLQHKLNTDSVKQLDIIMKSPVYPDSLRLKAARHLALSKPIPTYNYVTSYLSGASSYD